MGEDTMTEAAQLPATALHRDVVVIGASAGGVEALVAVFEAFPADLAASVFVVLHVMPGGTSVLPSILERAGPLPVAAAVDGEPLARGRAYTAPPDHHMLIEGATVRLTRGPRENGYRPAIDPLFRSAAESCGPRVIGVVLSGSLDDGSLGLRAISDAGGFAIVQDPAGAAHASMPSNALRHAPAAVAFRLERLGSAICAAIDEPLVQDGAARKPMRDEEDLVKETLTPLTCPDCGGPLWQEDHSGLLRFRCLVGHAFSAEAMQELHGQAVERALWAALRSLQERADLLRRLAARSASPLLEQKAIEAERHAEVLRPLVAALGAEPGTARDKETEASV